MRKQEPAAGQPAVTLPGIVTEQDREIVRRRDAGETRKAICDSLGVTVNRIYHAEYACRCDANGRKLLDERPDSIEGLLYIGELDGNAADMLRFHHYHYEGREIEGLSNVAALGRAYVSRIKGIGPKSLASIDRALSLFGMTWSPIDRTPKPLPPKQVRGAAPDVPLIDPAILAEVVSRVEHLERACGLDVGGIFRDNPARDTYEFIRGRLHYLSGYICGDERLSPSDTPRMRCTILENRARERWGEPVPEPVSVDIDDLESVGNLVCFPGVKLASVLCNDGSDPRPTTA
jgi:hypothetical protein